jgi:hypothetical protein
LAKYLHLKSLLKKYRIFFSFLIRYTVVYEEIHLNKYQIICQNQKKYSEFSELILTKTFQKPFDSTFNQKHSFYQSLLENRKISNSLKVV